MRIIYIMLNHTMSYICLYNNDLGLVIELII